MKIKIMLMLCLTLCCCNLAFSGSIPQSNALKTNGAIDPERYRNYPFQWVFPEYYYKADTVRVEKEKKTPQGFIRVEFFGLNTYVPAKFTEEIIRKNDAIFFKSKESGTIMMIKSSNDSIGCSDIAKMKDKDYCSAYKTPREFYHKLFTQTPDSAENTGDKWIVHGKGVALSNARKIEIYSSDKFVAYVKYIKNDLIEKTKFSHEITLFHANGPFNAYVTITFIDPDNTILVPFITTLE